MRVKLQRVFKNGYDGVVTARFHFQPYGRAPFSHFKGFFDFQQQVVRLVLIQGEVGIPCNPVCCDSDDLIAFKQHGHIHPYDLFQENIIGFGIGGGYLYQPGQDRGNLDGGKHGLVLFLSLQKDRKVQAFVQNQRERPALIDRHGS